MNTAALIQGVLNGLNYALLAVGLALVFRSNRFVNAAHAQLGIVSSLVLGKLVVDGGWPYWAAFVLALGAGVLVATVVERFVVRKLAATNALTLFIVSTGVAQLLLAVTFVSALQPNANKIVNHGYPVPFDVQVTVGGFVLRGQHVFTLVAAPLAAGALAALLRYTMFGKAVRAAASNPDAARLASVPVRRISAAVWATAGLLSALAAILQAPSQPVFNLQALGPGLLLRGLAAAALAGFTSLTGSFGIAVALGVTEGLLLSVTKSGGLTEVAMFAVIVVGLFARQATFQSTAVGAPSAPTNQLHVAASIRDRWSVRAWRPLAFGFAGFVLVVLPFLPPLRQEADRFLLAETVVFALVALSLTVLSGWSGQVSLGQFAFVGLGCFLTARLSDRGWTFGQCLAAAALLGALSAVVIGLPTVRSRGMLLAITTLGFGLIASGWLFRDSWLAGTPGDTTPPLRLTGLGPLRTQLSVYFASLAVLGVVALGLMALRNSAPGRAMVAVRDNEAAAAAFGLSPARVRLVALGLSGAIASSAGVLWLAVWRVADVAQFGPDNSFVALALPAVGGLQSVGGAVAGAVLVMGVPLFTTDLFRNVFSNSAGFVLFLSGAGLVGTQLQFPAGVAGAARRGSQWVLDRIAAEAPVGATAGGASVTPALAEPRAPRAPRREPWAGPLLSVRDIRLSFGGILALDGVSLDVHPGEIVGLIGANGAGKTTLFNVIAGALRPGEGAVLFEGDDITSVPTHARARRGIGRSFQDARLFAGLTVDETVRVAAAGERTGRTVAAFGGAPSVVRRERAIAGRAGAATAKFNLTPHAEVAVANLSTGMRRVTDFAAQSCARPRLLLLDEPTGGIAQRDAEAFGRMLRDLRDELDCAMLVIEHDLPLLLSIADRVFAMETGRIIAAGTPREVRDDPAVVASYLGSNNAVIHRSGRAS